MDEYIRGTRARADILGDRAAVDSFLNKFTVPPEPGYPRAGHLSELLYVLSLRARLSPPELTEAIALSPRAKKASEGLRALNG